MPGVNCREFEGALVGMARRAPLASEERTRLTAHLEGCETCRIVLNRQLRLSAASEVLAAEAVRFSAPASVEQALLREMTNMHRLRRRIVYGYLGGAIAATLALVWWIAYRPAPPSQAVAAAENVRQVAEPVAAALKRPASAHRKRVAKPARPPEQPFIAIPYTLPLEPYERADVMRMDLPVTALIAAGLPMSMADPAASARADVLVGQDGRARAIRLISISTSN